MNSAQYRETSPCFCCWTQCEVSEENNLKIHYKGYKICHTI